jgi:hypothetical protein
MNVKDDQYLKRRDGVRRGFTTQPTPFLGNIFLYVPCSTPNLTYLIWAGHKETSGTGPYVFGIRIAMALPLPLSTAVAPLHDFENDHMRRQERIISSTSQDRRENEKWGTYATPIHAIPFQPCLNLMSLITNQETYLTINQQLIPLGYEGGRWRSFA